MLESKQKLAQGVAEAEMCKAEAKKAELTKRELKSLPDSTPTYLAVGRMLVGYSIRCFYD